VTWIEPEQAPGGLVFVHYVDGQPELIQTLLPESMRDPDTLAASSAYAAGRALDWEEQGRTVELVVYDGDSGRPLMGFPLTLVRRAFGL
jgi:hypothetical protein